MKLLNFILILLTLATSSMVAACTLSFTGYDGPTRWGFSSPMSGRLLRDGREICHIPAGTDSDDLDGSRTKTLYLTCVDGYRVWVSRDYDKLQWETITLHFKDRTPGWWFRKPTPTFEVRQYPVGDVGYGGGFQMRGIGKCF